MNVEWLAKKWSSHRWWLPWFVLVTGFTAGISAAKLSHKTPPPDSKRYLVSTREIHAGEPFSFRALSYRYTDSAPPDAITDQELSDWEGARYRIALGSGEILRRSYFEADANLLAKQIPHGHRAYPLRPENFLTLQAGDQIDLYWIPSDENQAPTVLVDAVSVLSFRRGVKEVIAALSEVEIELVEKALRRGKLKIALHRFGDASKKDATRRKNRSLFRKKRREHPVEILTGEAP